MNEREASKEINVQADYEQRVLRLKIAINVLLALGWIVFFGLAIRLFRAP